MESIDSFLPKPKGTEQSSAPNDNALTVVSNLDSEGRQLLQQTYSIPPYGSRGPPNKWRPRNLEDYADGGAYPEIHVAQYPRNMGLPSGSAGARRNNKTLALTVNSSGEMDYSAIARNGHTKDRKIQSSFQDLVPLRQRANNGTISLERPSQETVAETANKTQLALQKIVDSKMAASKPKTAVASGPASQANATFVRYTPTNMMGQESANKQRIIKIVDVQEDPLAPPKFKHSKVPARPPSPPPPVLRSPPRKLTAEDQKNWYIPPSVSNWKNPKGFTIAIDKRMAADGRHLQEHTINDNFAKLAESLAVADTKMRQEVQYRNQQRKMMKQNEEQERENKLKELARKAKEEREAILQKGGNSRGRFDSDDEESHEEAADRRSVSRSPLRSRRRASFDSEGSHTPVSVERTRSKRRRGSESISPPPTPQRRRRGRRESESPSPSPEPGRRRRRRGSMERSWSSSDRSRSPTESSAGKRQYRDRGHHSRTRRSPSVSGHSDSEYESRSPPRKRSRDDSPRRKRYQRSRSSSDASRDRSRERDDYESRAERHRRLERAERLAEEKRKLRMSRMGTERRVKSMLKNDDRDISERVALGIAKPSAAGSEAQFDSRLMGRVSVSNTFNEDNVYDSSLFRSSEAAAAIYRAPKMSTKGEAEDEMDERISGEDRFDTLGYAKNGFQNAEERSGPVEFEKDDKSSGKDAVDEMFKQVKAEHDKKGKSRWD